mmetsp:Transcript_55031/g.128735  ORF Transcript_55031/g.128735 Transcript_55031/m.128735 type:complete len:174 (-) Transcript_55031:652-1173(-)
MAVALPASINIMRTDSDNKDEPMSAVQTEEGHDHKVLWEAGQQGDGSKPGPKRAKELTLRKYQDPLINKEVKVGTLWDDRIALVMLLPDIKSVRSRDMLLSAALMQVHLRKLGVSLCLIFPVSNPKFAQSCAEDFSLTMDNGPSHPFTPSILMHLNLLPLAGIALRVLTRVCS